MKRLAFEETLKVRKFSTFLKIKTDDVQEGMPEVELRLSCWDCRNNICIPEDFVTSMLYASSIIKPKIRDAQWI